MYSVRSLKSIRQLHEFVAWTHVAGDSQRLSISLQKVSFHTRVFCTESTDMAGVAKTDDIEHARNHLKKICTEFRRSNKIKRAAVDLGIKDNIYHRVSKRFCSSVLSLQTNDTTQQLLERILSTNDFTVDELFPYFIDYIQNTSPMLLVRKSLKITSDLTDQRNWYPYAQQLQRKFILHIGPTNSGKTYHAHQHFLSSPSGVYCSPLRMLATEMYNKTNLLGVACDLVTGEERRYGSGLENEPAQHVASTIEMVNTNPLKPYDVAVIDEIQMIQDSERGGAWTRALLGIPAHTVHICGEPTCVPLIKRLVGTKEGNIEIIKYKRLNPLVAMKRSLKSSYNDIKPGDCIVAFSRNEIFKIKQEIEKTAGCACATVYGGLPAATRSSEADRFNHSDVKVLVASDAIGMGLNLNIKRIIFHSVYKFNGISVQCLTPSQLKQIAGRAGRYSGDHARGEVTTFHDKDLHLLHKLLTTPLQHIEKAGLAPSFEQIETFSSYLPDFNLPRILSLFLRTATVSEDFFLCKPTIERQIIISKLLASCDLSLKDHYALSLAPVDIRSANISDTFQQFVKLSFEDAPLTAEQLHSILSWPIPRPRTHSELIKLEETHEIINLYLWLNQRYPRYFPLSEEAGKLQKELEETIDLALRARIKQRPLQKDTRDRSTATTTTRTTHSVVRRVYQKRKDELYCT